MHDLNSHSFQEFVVEKELRIKICPIQDFLGFQTKKVSITTEEITVRKRDFVFDWRASLSQEKFGTKYFNASK